MKMLFGFLLLVFGVESNAAPATAPAAPGAASPNAPATFISPVRPQPFAGYLRNMSIFAFPGSSCPIGSLVYKGPAAKMAAGKGFIYCEIDRNIIVLNKKEVSGCPSVSRPYVHPTVKPDDDVIWCERLSPPVVNQPNPPANVPPASPVPKK